MKRIITQIFRAGAPPAIVGVVIVASGALAPQSFGQGSLTPPGAPAPTFKTLQQIEPRTPIPSLPYAINQPGSYYLTTNVSVCCTGITISARNVTLDLNGFSIRSNAVGAHSAILINFGQNINIRNGHIDVGSFIFHKFNNGITFAGPFHPDNVRVTDVSVSDCVMAGINLGTNNTSVVERCTVLDVGGEGIRAGVVSQSTATRCGTVGIAARMASDCYAQSMGAGVIASTAQNCHGIGGSASGVVASIAEKSRGESNSGIGVSAVTAQNCYGVSGSYYGVFTTTAQNCRGSSDSNYGLLAAIAQNCFGSSGAFVGLHADIAIGC